MKRLRDPDWIRTNDLLLRRQLLYPAELPDQWRQIYGTNAFEQEELENILNPRLYLRVIYSKNSFSWYFSRATLLQRKRKLSERGFSISYSNFSDMKFTLIFSFVLFAVAASAQSEKLVRLAKLDIDSAQLDQYKAFLKEEIETSLRVEPGVLTLYAVFEKNNPTKLTILEIYADTSAYQHHIKTPHFLKYKNGTANMVRKLELVDVEPIISEMKP